MTRRIETAAVVLLLAAALAGYLAALAALFHYTVDDAFITFRYAHNFARGWGLNFNHAPPPAEGYTSVLWTLLLAIPESLQLDPVPFAKTMGLVFTAGTVVLVARATWRAGAAQGAPARRLGAAFACALLLGFSNAAAHAISGMETALAACLYALVTWLYVTAEEDPRALPWACLALGLTRPEANLFAVGVLAATLLELPRERRARFVRACVVGYVLPGALYFGVRAVYYGRAFPLPFYVKATGGGLPGLRATASFVANALVGCAVPLVVLARARRRRLLLLLLPVALVLAYFLRVDPIMGYGHRYPFPLLPVLAVLAGAGFAAAAARSALARAACVAGLAAACAFGFVKTRQALPAYAAYTRGLERAHGMLAQGLSRIAWTRPASIAIGDAGLVPYATDLPTLDTYGLNEPAIAVRSGGDRTAIVRARRPTVLILISRERDRFRSPLPWEDALWNARAAGDSTRRATFRFADDYWLWALWSPGDPDAARIEQALEDAARRNEQAWAGGGAG